MGKEIELTANNFEEEVLKSDIPVIVDFWADWCMPCKMIAPAMESIAEEYEGKVKVSKLDVDAHGEIASKYNIISIPTILLFYNGEVVKQHVGAAPKDSIIELFQEYIN